MVRDQMNRTPKMVNWVVEDKLNLTEDRIIDMVIIIWYVGKFFIEHQVRHDRLLWTISFRNLLDILTNLQLTDIILL